jgi:aconitate hydratase
VDILSTQLEVYQPLTMIVHPKDGDSFPVQLSHTFNAAQIKWFQDGSALNTMAKHS